MNGALYLGGSFNPPHIAHLISAAAAAREAGLKWVVLIPTGQPALKDPADIAPAADRLAMTRLAADLATVFNEFAVPFSVDDLEIARPGTSYTIDTVTALIAKGVWPVHWLIGADQLLNLHRWHRFEDLLRDAHLIVMARPGYAIDWAAVHPAVRTLRDNVVTVPQFDISATEIRRRLRAGESVEGMLAPAVRDYCVEHGLYRTKPV